MQRDNRMTGANSSCLFAVVHGIISSTNKNLAEERDCVKKKLLYVLIPLVCIIGVFIYFSNILPTGDTVESREALLDNAISGGNNWIISKEIEIDNYIISCAYSANGKSTIAVFEPISNGKYKFSTSTNRDNDNIIIGRAIISGEWYDLFWFNFLDLVIISNQKISPEEFRTSCPFLARLLLESCIASSTSRWKDLTIPLVHYFCALAEVQNELDNSSTNS